MRNKILFIFVLILLLSFSFKASASQLCSSNGYTILTINGIFTNNEGAAENKRALERKLLVSPTYNNQKLTVDYLYNPTHLAGASDLIDSIAQGAFNEKNDYDLTNMLNDASQKVKTQKLLLVAHSQGNFYANNFYEKVASQEGGVPKESMGVYGVASPASRVGGGGKYLTSDTDSVITGTVARYIKILPPNIHIPLQPVDGNGHNFSEVYLKYKGDRVISDIKSSLNKLKENDEQISEEPCISPPKLTALHKVKGALFAVADPTASAIKSGAVGVYNAGAFVADSGVKLTSFLYKGALYLAKTIGNFTTTSLASVFSSVGGNNLVEESPAIPENVPPEIVLANEGPMLTQPETTIPTVDSEPAQASAPEIISTPAEDLSNNNVESEPPPVTQQTSNTPPVYYSGGGSSPVRDTTAPVISIIGDDPLVIEKNTLYSDPGATAIDDTDTTVTVVATGDIDTSVVGTYTKTYTATDAAGNVATLTRTINVIESSILDTTAPVITINGDTDEIVVLNSLYTDLGATAEDDVDGPTAVVVTGVADTSKIGDYVITYTATDVAGNISTETRNVKVVTYKYIPKYSFGSNNGDGNDWQVWSFNGSNVYDWSNSYVDNYLKEQFKILSYSGGSGCADNCLQRGIFNHDPEKGFEPEDVISKTTLENNPQNNGNDTVYDVVIEWDSTGYIYTISHGGTVDSTLHVSVPNIDENTWTGWNSSLNDFKTFPSGNWQGVIASSPDNKTGGDNMILQPYLVYVYSGPVLSKEKKITSFNFDGLTPSVVGTIDENTYNVFLKVPFGTDVTNLIPTIGISDKAIVNPGSGVVQDFTNPVVYTATAENGLTQAYTVTVTFDVDPNLPPTITSYTFNDEAADFSTDLINPGLINIAMNASKKVNWMSIKIEYENDDGFYKMFQSDSSNCVDDTNVCKKTWDGTLSKGGLLRAGKYKVKLHMKDALNNEYYDYLSPYVINIVSSY
ncbi:MAG: immunoglobulin-like domain-containing protein [bacterium]